MIEEKRKECGVLICNADNKIGLKKTFLYFTPSRTALLIRDIDGWNHLSDEKSFLQYLNLRSSTAAEFSAGFTVTTSRKPEKINIHSQEGLQTKLRIRKPNARSETTTVMEHTLKRRMIIEPSVMNRSDKKQAAFSRHYCNGGSN